MGFFGGTSSLFKLPDEIAFNLVGWWDASDSTKVVGSSPGVANYLRDVRSTSFNDGYYWWGGAETPLAQIKGRNALGFNGNNFYTLYSGDTSAPSFVTEAFSYPATGEEQTCLDIVIVAKNTAVLGTLLSQNISATITSRQLQIFRSSDASSNPITTFINRGREESLSDNFDARRSFDLDSVSEEPFIVSMTYNYTAPHVVLSSSANVTKRILPVSFAPLETGARIKLGARSNGTITSQTAFLTGAIGEIIVFKTADAFLSPIERGRIFNYLIKKWNIRQFEYFHTETP